jgi:hypothetical protein
MGDDNPDINNLRPDIVDPPGIIILVFCSQEGSLGSPKS